MVYYAAPNLKQRCWQWLSPGALFATLGWIAASGLLRLYFRFFTSYAKTYGPLGGVMVLMRESPLSRSSPIPGHTLRALALEALV
jgi:membrane protein